MSFQVLNLLEDWIYNDDSNIFVAELSLFFSRFVCVYQPGIPTLKASAVNHDIIVKFNLG